MKKIFAFLFWILITSFTFKLETNEISYYVPLKYYNFAIKCDSSHKEFLNPVYYIINFHKAKQLNLASCIGNLYGADVSYYKNCDHYKDSTVYHFGKISLSKEEQEFDKKTINFWSVSNKIYLVEYKLDSKHLKLVSESNNDKQIIWFKFIGNQRPDWICKK